MISCEKPDKGKIKTQQTHALKMLDFRIPQIDTNYSRYN